MQNMHVMLSRVGLTLVLFASAGACTSLLGDFSVGSFSGPDATSDATPDDDSGADSAESPADSGTQDGGTEVDGGSGDAQTDACSPGLRCIPANPCHVGAISCSTGLPTCVDQGTSQPDGTSCGSPRTCHAGACACAFADLQVYYKCDGNLNDSSGNGKFGNGSNIAYTNGKFGQACTFNGSNTSVQVVDQVTFPTISGARTVCAWVQPAGATSGLGLPIANNGSTSGDDWLGVQSVMPSSSSCAAGPNTLYIDHQGSPCIFGTAAINPGAWNYVCYSYDGSGQITLFSNGSASVLQGSYSLYGWWLGSMNMGSDPSDPSSTSTTRSFDGAIDEFAYWTQALTQAQMSALYDNGSGCPAN